MAGTVTLSVTVPLVQATVAGSPERAGVEENAQLVAFVTSAESETGPPEAVREVGAAAKFDTVGLEAAACDTAGATNAAAPARASPKVAPRTGMTRDVGLNLDLMADRLPHLGPNPKRSVYGLTMVVLRHRQNWPCSDEAEPGPTSVGDERPDRRLPRTPQARPENATRQRPPSLCTVSFAPPVIPELRGHDIARRVDSAGPGDSRNVGVPVARRVSSR